MSYMIGLTTRTLDKNVGPKLMQQKSGPPGLHVRKSGFIESFI